MTYYMRKLDVADAREFDVLLRAEPEGGFTVRVPAFPEIVSYGENEAEALAMAQEAIELVIEDRVERGEPIPAPDVIRLRSVAVAVPA